MTTRKYTPSGFKQAFEQKLRQTATEKQEPINRTRMIFIFDRLLARLTREFADAMS